MGEAMPWPNTLWPEEKTDKLKQMVADGIPFSKIAEEIGMTRSSCIGKASRLGLSIRDLPWKNNPNYINQKKLAKIASEERRKERAAQKAKERFERKLDAIDKWTIGNTRERRHGSLPPRPPIAPVSVGPLNLTMGALSSAELHLECRYITNDDMSAPLYCGHQTVNGSSWCEFHYKRIFVPRFMAPGTQAATGGRRSEPTSPEVAPATVSATTVNAAEGLEASQSVSKAA